LECEKIPADLNEWNSGKREYTIKQKIILFLNKNYDQAFNIKEIIEGIGYQIEVVMQDYGETPQSRFRRILEILAEEGSVEIRAINRTGREELYYKSVNDQKS
jgi:hypothetical protein